MTFTRSPLARLLTQLMMLIAAIAVASTVSELLAHDASMLLPFFAACLVISSPLLVDLWVKVEADGAGIAWRNRFATRRAPWTEVTGFRRGAVSMELVLRDGSTVALRVLGLRYFGSKKLALQRVAVLEHLRLGT